MEQVLAFLKEFNFQTIISLAVIVWYFNRSLENKIDKLDHDFREMNTRVGRVEGTVYGKDIYKNVQ